MENTQSEKIPEGRGTFIPKKGIDLQISALSRPHFFHREKKKSLKNDAPAAPQGIKGAFPAAFDAN